MWRRRNKKEYSSHAATTCHRIESSLLTSGALGKEGKRERNLLPEVRERQGRNENQEARIKKRKANKVSSIKSYNS